MISPAMNTQPETVQATDRHCIRCAYSLHGLPHNGNCPECGTPVELSLREPTLANAAPEYVLSLRSGLSFVLNGILLSIILMVGSVFVVAALQGSQAWMQFAAVANLFVTAIILFGYWRFTEPDPAQVALEATRSARTVVRVTVVAQAVLAVVSIGAEFLPTSVRDNPLVEIFEFVLQLAALAAWAVQFFGMMRYTRWVATRIPDQFIIKRTRLYMWLLPVLGTVGMVLVGLGPLIALIMYWNLLDRARKQLKSILKDGKLADLKGRLG
jgi:hypothetical protein